MQLTPAQESMTAFASLRERVHGKPQNVGWMAGQSPEVALLTLVVELAWRKLEMTLVTSPSKAFNRAPRGLKAAYRDYKQEWLDIVARAADDIVERHAERIQKAFESAHEATDSYSSTDSDRPEFDPTRDDPVDVFEDMVWFSGAYADAYDDHELGDQQRVAGQAWDFLCDTLGLDLRAFWQRWQRVEPIFVPAHVADAYGRSEPASLNRQLDEAVHAYVFGASAAALTMCRALMELVLTKHYGCDGDDLQKVIAACEARPQHAWMKRLDLQAKRRIANRVLHDHRAVEEEAVVEFLKTVRELIERAPAPR